MKKLLILLFLFISLPIVPTCEAQVLDVLGGRMDSVCTNHPHSMAFTGATQSGTSGTIPLSNTSGWVPGQPVIIKNTGTLLDTTLTNNPAASGAPTISSITPNVSLNLLMPSSHTILATNGIIEPGFSYSGLIISGPMTGQVQNCDPIDHWLYPIGLAEFQPITNGIIGGASAAETKYAVTSACAVMSFLMSEMRHLKYTVVAEDSETQATATGSCSGISTGLMPTISGTANVSLYAMNNLANCGSGSSSCSDQATVNIADAYAPALTSNIGFVRTNAEGLPDTFSPHYVTFVTNNSANSGSRITNVYVITVLRDDTDGVACSGAAGDFSSFGKHTNCNPAYVIMVSSPLETLTNTALYGTGWPKLLPDPRNFTKMSYNYNPYGNATIRTAPLVCSYTTTRCSLQDYLCGISGVSLYAGIGALNGSTAWNSGATYDSCGTDGVPVVGVCSPTPNTGCLGTGDGTQTVFTATLPTNVDPHSVLILLNGTAVAGDCPQFAKRCTAAVGQGTLMSPGDGPEHGVVSTGTVVYGTPGSGGGSGGSITVTFTSAPASGASVTADYVFGGWPRNGPGGGGHGLMDEDGSDTATIGSNGYCLVSSLIYPGTCADGDQSAPNAQAQAGQDLDNYVSQYAAQYACTIKAGAEAGSGVGVSYWGLNFTGAWTSPAHRGWYQGESQCTTGLFIGSDILLSHPDSPARYAFISQYTANNLPFFTETFDAAQQGPGGCSSIVCQPTEQAKGAFWFNIMSALLVPDTFDNKIRIASNNWWSPYRCFSGCGGDHSDYAIKSGTDNLIDGHEISATAVSCSTPLGAFPCGNEPVTYTYNITAGSWVSTSGGTETLTLGQNVIGPSFTVVVSGTSFDGSYVASVNGTNVTNGQITIHLATNPGTVTSGTVTWTSTIPTTSQDLVGTLTNGLLLNGNNLWLALKSGAPPVAPQSLIISSLGNVR